MAARDLSSSQVERLRAAVKGVWATGKYSTKTAMANAGRVFQAQISNLLNDAPVGISFPTADKICRNLLGKSRDEIIGAADDPVSARTELEFALDMAKAGHIPEEAVAAALTATNRSAPYDRFEWLFLFKGAAFGVVQRDTSNRAKSTRSAKGSKKKTTTARPAEALPASKRKASGAE